MVSPTQLAVIRTGFQNMGFGMPDDVAIRHITAYANTPQGYTPTYGSPTHVAGRYAALSGRELEWVKQMGIQASCTVTMPANTSIQPKDVLTITVAETGATVILEVTYLLQRTQEFARRVYCDYFPSDASVLTSPENLVARAFDAAQRGWQQLGTFGTGIFMRESDLIYNPDDGYYYLFNTERDGTVIPLGSFTITNWQATGLSAAITISGTHNVPVGTRAALNVTGTVAGGGSGTINGVRVCLATSTSTFTATLTVSVNNSGSTGSMVHTLSPQVGMRRATTLSALTTASGANFISRVAQSIYYPTIVYVPAALANNNGLPAWYMFGFGAGGFVGEVVRARCLTAFPATVNAFGTPALVSSLTVSGGVAIGDISIRLNPADNFYYAVGTDPIDIQALRIYKIPVSAIATDAWQLVTANVFATIGVPPWMDNGLPDPNIYFVDGSVYLGFSGTHTQLAGEASCAIVELDSANNYQAFGLIALLQTPATYNSWQVGVQSPLTLLSDLIFLRCPDGIDRIVGFTNDLAYGGVGNGTWGMLELN